MSPGESVAWLSFWAAVATAVMLLAGVIYTARKGHQSTQQASAVGMTGALYERIDKLESQVAELDELFEKVFDTDTAFSTDAHRIRRFNADNVFNFLAHPIRVSRWQVNFIEYRHNFQI